MAAVYVNNFVIDQGVDFSQKLNIETISDFPVNLSGYGISSYIRKHPESKNIVAGFAVSFTNPSIGEITISLGSTITSTIKEGKYVYDMILKQNGTQKKSMIMEGMVLVRSGITT